MLRLEVSKFSSWVILFWIPLVLGSSFTYATMKVAIYQGSFDPLTKGHEEIIKFLLKENYEVYVVPDRTTGYKELNSYDFRKKLIKASAHRLEQDAGNSHKVIFLDENELRDREAKTKAKDQSRSGTDMWDINRHVMKRYKNRTDVEFYNAVGADTLKWIGTYPEPRKYLPKGKMKQIRLLVLDRPFSSGNQKFSGYLAKNGEQGVRDLLIESQKTSGDSVIETTDGRDFIYGQMVLLQSISGLDEISSTKVRNCLSALRSITGIAKIPNVSELAGLKLKASHSSSKAVIAVLEGLLSPEVINVLSELNEKSLQIYYKKGKADECTPEFKRINVSDPDVCVIEKAPADLRRSDLENTLELILNK